MPSGLPGPSRGWKQDLERSSRPPRLLETSGFLGVEPVRCRALVLRKRAGGVADLPGRVVQHHFTCRHSQPGWALQADRFTYAVFLALVSAGTRDVLRLSRAA